MNRKISIRVICLITALVVLGGAVAFAAVTGSPYETLKKSLLNAAVYSNVTIETHAAFRINGETYEEMWSREMYGNNGNLRYRFDEFGEISGFFFSANGLEINSDFYPSSDGTQWHIASINPAHEYYSRYNNWISLDPDDLNSAQARFIELLVDAAVGDLKNNITMSSSNGTRTIRATISGSQIPELVKAGIDVLVEQSGSYYGDRRDVGFENGNYIYEEIRINSGTKTVTTWSEPARKMTADEAQAWEDGLFWERFPDIDMWGATHGPDGTVYLIEGPRQEIGEYSAPAEREDFVKNNFDPWDIPMKSLVIDYIRGEMLIDENDDLISINVSGAATITNIFGDVSEFEAEGSMRFLDIGTSSPTSPIPGAESILTSERMETLFGIEYTRHYMSVFFTLDENGRINENSLTTTHPAELERINSRSYMVTGPGALYSTPKPFGTVYSTLDPVPEPAVVYSTSEPAAEPVSVIEPTGEIPAVSEGILAEEIIAED